MRCPRCQATNPESAAFCGQCYLRFDTIAAAETASPLPRRGSPATPADPGEASDVTPQEAPAEPAEAQAERSVLAGRFHAVGEGIGWTCAVCGSPNDLSTFTCEICGSRMDAERASTHDVDIDAAIRLEAMIPGLGFLKVGLTPMGLARLSIALLWLIGGILLATGGADGLLTAVPLVIGIGVLLATGPGDLRATRAGRTPRLEPRRFGYLVLGVTLGVISAGALTLVL